MVTALTGSAVGTKRLTGVVDHASLGPPGLPSFLIISVIKVGIDSSTVGFPIALGRPATEKRFQPWAYYSPFVVPLIADGCIDTHITYLRGQGQMYCLP